MKQKLKQKNENSYQKLLHHAPKAQKNSNKLYCAFFYFTDDQKAQDGTFYSQIKDVRDKLKYFHLSFTRFLTEKDDDMILPTLLIIPESMLNLNNYNQKVQFLVPNTK